MKDACKKGLDAFNEVLKTHVMFSDVAPSDHPFNKWLAPEDGQAVVVVEIDTDVTIFDGGLEISSSGDSLFIGDNYMAEDGAVQPVAPIYMMFCSKESVEELERWKKAEEEAGRALSPDEEGYEEWLKTSGWAPDISLHRMQNKEDGRLLNLGDLLISLAIQDARARGDEAAASELEKVATKESMTCSTCEYCDKSKDEIPALEAIKPWRHYEPNAKTTRVLTDPALIEGEELTLLVGKDKRGQQLRINFGLAFIEDAGAAQVDTTEPIDPEDVAVIAAVVTLKEAGNTVITPFQIADQMGYENPSEELQDEIHARFMRLRNIDGRIDWTAQARAYKKTDPITGQPYERAILQGRLIDAPYLFDGTDVKGNRCIRYKLGVDPLTYQHAHLIDQVIDYPQNLLNTLKPVDEDGNRAKRVTREQKQIARQILNYVYSLKNPKNRLNDTVWYDTLFASAGVEMTSPKKRQTAVRFVNGYLRALQAEGIIYGFMTNARGRAHKPHSVKIVVSKPRKVKKLQG